MKKNILLFISITLIATSFCFSQQIENTPKIISGFITANDAPLAAVNIKIENHLSGTKTNSKGFYEIKAREGDIIKYSHVGYQTVTVVVEDITDILNIEMNLQTNELGTAVVNARKKVKGMVEIEHEKRTATIETGAGKLNLKALGQKVNYIAGTSLSPGLAFLDAIRGKFTGTLPDLWEIDGFLYKVIPEIPPPHIDVATIEDIYILNRSIGTARWGGPVMIIRTSMSASQTPEEKERLAEQHHNQNFYQNDAVPIDASEEILPQPNLSKTVTGTITYLDAPVPNVHVVSQLNNQGVQTDDMGAFTIQTAIGDELTFSHLSFSSVYIIVEDITDVLNIALTPKNNELDEVYLENKVVKGEVQEQFEKSQRKFETSRGAVDPKKSGFAVTYLDGKDIKVVGHGSLTRALAGKFAGYSIGADGLPYLRGGNMSVTQKYPAIWDIDGQIFTSEPPLSLSEIEDVYVLKAVGAVVKYGNVANGGVIIVKTKYGNFGELQNKANPSTAKLQNKDYYANDAITFEASNVVLKEYVKTLKTFKNEETAIAFYEVNWAKNIKSPHLRIALAKKAQQLFPSNQLAVIIYRDIAKEHSKDPEILKAVAYQLQATGLKKEAISMYEKIYTLRPTYAQSYRDLSNAYIENEQFKRGWRLYLSYLFQGHNLNDEGIGELLYNEMEWIYFNRKNQTEIKELFLPKNEDVYEFRDDVRVVVEWNTSEAEFDLEFVSPDKRSYVFEHTLAGAQEIITKEKKNGYSSKQFFVDDLEEGDWLFNVSYYGNKKPEPTYLKVTSYYNWGLPHQTQQTKVFTLNRTATKFQLITYNKDNLQQVNTIMAKN